MNKHARLYEIVQKVFNAGQKFEHDSFDAIAQHKNLPAAYPVITPLINDLVEYVNDCIMAERHICAEIAHDFDDMATEGLIRKRSRPSSPFRSVEIENGRVVESEKDYYCYWCGQSIDKQYVYREGAYYFCSRDCAKIMENPDVWDEHT